MITVFIHVRGRVTSHSALSINMTNSGILAVILYPLLLIWTIIHLLYFFFMRINKIQLFLMQFLGYFTYMHQLL
ncbi:hypothetical protein CW304_29595 [Bacillus sp. UFRGS-B20]|nr:hypothetical protein CW304_29595 [Bacillus sp. UFRGS-B20]